jgi:hypothetical protein
VSRLIKVSPVWFETPDGRYVITKSPSGTWRLASACEDGWQSEEFGSKKEAAEEWARRVEEEASNA